MRVDEHTISLDDSPVYYRTAEVSGMPTVYLHGIPTSSDDWPDFLGRTGGIAPDLVGFGRSAKGGHLSYSLGGLAAFVERLLGHLGIGDVQVVGHDWGAAVGLAFANRNPGRVRRIVLCNPAPVDDPAQWPRILRLWRTRGAGELVMGAMTKALLARTLRRGSVRADAWPAARIAAVWEQFDQGTQRAILRLVRSAADDVIGGCGPRGSGGPRDGSGGPEGGSGGPRDGSGGPRDGSGGPEGGSGGPEGGSGGPEGGSGGPEGGASGGLGGHPHAEDPRERIDVSVLWGERDPWYPPTVADAYAARLPGARVERIADAGHWPWLDRPEVVDRVAALLEG